MEIDHQSLRFTRSSETVTIWIGRSISSSLSTFPIACLIFLRPHGLRIISLPKKKNSAAATAVETTVARFLGEARPPGIAKFSATTAAPFVVSTVATSVVVAEITTCRTTFFERTGLNSVLLGTRRMCQDSFQRLRSSNTLMCFLARQLRGDVGLFQHLLSFDFFKP